MDTMMQNAQLSHIIQSNIYQMLNGKTLTRELGQAVWRRIDALNLIRHQLVDKPEHEHDLHPLD